MGSIRVTDFGGIIPRRSERLLPNNGAQVAVNCNLSSGELTPFKYSAKAYTSGKTGPLLTAEHIADDASSAWLTWRLWPGSSANATTGAAWAMVPGAS